MAKKVKKEIGSKSYDFPKYEYNSTSSTSTLTLGNFSVGETLSMMTVGGKTLKITMDKRMTRASVLRRYNKFFKDNGHPCVVK